MRQIAENAGLEGSVVAERVANLPAGQGLNAANGEYEDLLKSNIADPVKVTRSALQNAASIAGMFLTTEAVVADKPEPPCLSILGCMRANAHFRLHIRVNTQINPRLGINRRTWRPPHFQLLRNLQRQPARPDQ